MTDRELLELAAKAGGIRDDFKTSWNPLRFKGDTFCLLVSLSFRIEFDEWSESSGRCRVWCGTHWVKEIWNYRLDKEKVTMRAITRAAAEIGRAMP